MQEARLQGPEKLPGVSRGSGRPPRDISIALKAIQSNQPDRALRFLEKAQRLYPTPRVLGECKMPETLRGH